MKKILTALAFISLISVSALAQSTTTPPPTCDDLIGKAADAIKPIKAAIANANPTNSQENQIGTQLNNTNMLATCLATRTATAAVKKNLEAKRTDVQAGAPASASGTTTAVSSASKPNFLGLALENGAVAKTTSGTSTSISINPWRFIDSLAHDENVHADPTEPLSRVIQRFSLSATLNPGSSTGSSTKTTSTTTGANPTSSSITTQLKEVSNVTVHFDIVNKRDPMSGAAAKAIRERIRMDPVANKALFDALDSVTAATSQSALDEVNKVKAPSFTGDIKTELTSWLDTQYTLHSKDPALMTAAAQAEKGMANLAQANKDLFKQIAHSPTLSLEYSLDRQPTVAASSSTSTASTSAMMNTPNLNTGRLISAVGMPGADFTFNASASFFGQKPTGAANSWRDYQFGAKVDIPFAGITSVVDKGTLTFSGLFVDLKQAPLGVNLMVNGVSVTQPGRIALFQAKYTVPLGTGSGVQVPISITYSNRTDLIKDTSIQGNIGITFDMSKLVATKQASTPPPAK